MIKLIQQLVVAATCCTLISCAEKEAEVATTTYSSITSKSANNKLSVNNYYRSAMATDNVQDLLVLIERIVKVDSTAFDHSLKTKVIAKQASMTEKETVKMLKLMSGSFQLIQIDAIKPLLLSKNRYIAEQAYLLLLELPLNKKTRAAHMQVMQHTTSTFIKNKAKSLLTG